MKKITLKIKESNDVMTAMSLKGSESELSEQIAERVKKIHIQLFKDAMKAVKDGSDDISLSHVNVIRLIVENLSQEDVVLIVAQQLSEEFIEIINEYLSSGSNEVLKQI